MKRVLVADVKVGDVVHGPDGLSTVIEIIRTSGFINFNFAEKNHCWWGLRPDEYIIAFLAHPSASAIQNSVN